MDQSDSETKLENGLLEHEKTQKELDDEIKRKKEKQVITTLICINIFYLNHELSLLSEIH